MHDWRKHEMDERVLAVEHQAGYIAYQVLGYLMILDMMLRAWHPEWVDWNGMPVDIPVVMLIAGAVEWTIKVRKRIVGPRRLRNMSMGIGLAMGLAILIGIVMQKVLH